MRAVNIVAALAFLELAAAGCKTLGLGDSDTHTYPLSFSNDVPAAQGAVKVSPGKGPNVQVAIDVKHLASPDRIRPGANAYVVWLTPQGSETPQNMGVLSLGGDEEGRFETETAFHDFNIFVTAEPSPAARNPTGQAMLRAAVQQPRTTY
jgi:hypothetical protein